MAATLLLAVAAPGGPAAAEELVALAFVRAAEEAVLSPAAAGVVTAMAYREGDAFPAGAVLAAIACDAGPEARCADLVAPFAGRVVERIGRPHERLAAGQGAVRIAADGREIEVVAPAAWLGRLAVGQRFRFRADGTGLGLEARVTRLGAVVDAVTQTFRVFGVAAGQPAEMLPGLSGTATFPPPGS